MSETEEIREFTEEELDEQRAQLKEDEQRSKEERLMSAAPMIEQELSKDPSLTVDQIAGITGAGSVTVAETLNEVMVEDGDFLYLGPGQGGGWAPARVAAEEQRKQHVALLDEQIAEREKLLKSIPENGDAGQRESRQGLTAMLGELKARKEELGEGS